MSKPIHALAQQLTGKHSLEDCTIEELRRLAQRYPYFAPAQFLLLQKLRQSGSAEEADAQYKKAILFYPDPLQFEYFIASGKFFGEESLLEVEDNHDITPAPLPDASLSEEDPGLDTYQDQLAESQPTPEPEAVLVNPLEEPGHVHELDVQEPEQSTTVFSEDEQMTVKDEVPPAVDATDDTHEEQAIESLQPIEEDFMAEEQPAQDESNTGTSEVTIPHNETALVSEVHQNKATELTFEPYHTVDYFASQGIKILSDELPRDKLGKQLKSFTEWLKTMKRLPAAQMAEAAEASAEKKVETLADRSLAGSEVVTEAMADVWAKQGNREKALDIYNKLSLQNPSKTAYFAAKIQTLKQS